MRLFLDTETTGLTSLCFVTSRNYTRWPRLVQIAWALADADDRLENIKCRLIRPSNFSIPIDATRIHKIDTIQALNEGLHIASVLLEFAKDLERASCLVGHNCRFDIGVIQSENLRLAVPMALHWPEKRICTMQEGASFLRRQKDRCLYANPSLVALHRLLFGNEHPQKHDAEADLKACYKVFRKLRDADLQ